MCLVIIFMGYGLIKVPMRSWSGRSVEHNLSYCYFNVAKSLAVREKLYKQLEEMYTVGSIKQVISALITKYRKTDGLELQFHYLKETYAQIPTQFVIEIESKHKSSKILREIHEKAISKYNDKPITLDQLVKVSTELKNLINRYSINKSKYRQMVADAVYFEHVMMAINTNQKMLPPSVTAFYGTNRLFKCFPSLGRPSSSQKSTGTRDSIQPTASQRSSPPASSRCSSSRSNRHFSSSEKLSWIC